ncbi:MAG TPA: hypothetical protein VMV69_13145 [Pirellulales bacterium]|nr:hypothetical protein [Pirellulales bacterium]
MELSSWFVACCLLGQTTSAKPGTPPARTSKADLDKTEPSIEPAAGEEAAAGPDAKPSTTEDEEANSAGAPDPNPPATPLADESTDQGLVPVTPTQVKQGAAEALIRQLALPSDAPFPGKPVSLVESLSRSLDRRRQMEIAHAYWNLSAAMADYETCVVELSRLEQLLPQPSGGKRVADLDLEASLAAAHARQRELELNVLTAQYELAEFGGWTAGEALPLPNDVPHAGAYATRAHEIYATRVAPPRVHLIDRALPLRLRSLDMRAMAVHAAADAADSAEQAYHDGQGAPARGGDLAVPLTAVAELARQQRAFVAAVRDYNHEIAEYALGIAPPGIDAATLVRMLIGPPNGSPPRAAPAGRPEVAEQPGGVNPAGFNAPSIPDAIQNPGRRRYGEPTLAPPRGGDPSERRRESRKVPAGDIAAGDGAETGAPAAGATVGLYPALAELSPKQRTQQLASMLHWDRALPDSLGVGSDLAGCLARAPGADRRALIKTYWLARERVARYQLMAQRIEQLDGLVPTALRAGGAPGGAAAMLRLHRSQLAAQADLATARVDLLVAQFELVLAGRWPIDTPWPVPSTAPHGGSYRLGLDRQRGEFTPSLAARRLAARIPALHQVLLERAESIVAIDAARARAASRYDAGEAAIDEPLAATEEQAAESSAFLAAQTEYNVEIVDYALSVLPAGTSDSRLVESLVLATPADGAGQ